MQTNSRIYKVLNAIDIPQNMVIHQLSEQSFKFHSSFRNGINFEYNENLLFIGNRLVPFGIRVPETMFDWRVFDEFTQCKITPTYINIYNSKASILINLQEVRGVSCSLANSNISKELCELLEEKLEAIELDNGFNMKPSEFGNSARLHYFSLKDLVGRGIGLTPSGDDIIIGYAFGCILTNGNTDQIKFLDEIDVSSTTRVSREYFKYVKQSLFSIELVNLVESLKGKRKIDHSIQEIINIGSTSGIDTLTGILLRLYEYEGKL